MCAKYVHYTQNGSTTASPNENTIHEKIAGIGEQYVQTLNHPWTRNITLLIRRFQQTQLLTARKNVELEVRTRTRLTTLSASGKTSINMALGQIPRLVISSVIKTMSPTLMLRSQTNHFWRCCKIGRYSFIHRFQNKSAKSWTERQEWQ